MLQRSRIVRSLFLFAALWALLCPHALAAVVSTPEGAGGPDTIYVAGNPDWYPVEYYDRDSGTYEGILPALLERISRETGLDFAYIQAGTEDQRQRQAKNNQVELVSGCEADEAWLLASGMHLSAVPLSIPTENGSVDVCLAFTSIADDALIHRVEDALTNLPPEEIAGLSVQVLMEHPEKTGQRAAAVSACAALLLLVLAAVQAVKLHRYKKATEQDNRVDPLTGIWNKTYFTEFFETFISDQYRNLYCVVYIGFDIGRVNQYYGETAADEQLCFAANELRLSTHDNEVSARIDGGAFAVARPGSSEQEIRTWTEQLLERLNRFPQRYGRDYCPEFRAGIYMLRFSDRDCETALFNARQGYQAAVAKGLPAAVIQPEHLALERERLQLKKRIAEGLRRREFQMFLQFIVDGKDETICGAEAVTRWEHPQKGLLYPRSYIELMEAEGSIVDLDFYMFEEVCRQLERWQAQGRFLFLSCNFSRITIGQSAFVSKIKEISSRYSFDHSSLILEITEAAMESNKELAFSNISECRKLGFQIALDDVGSGYTSFSDLRDYPIDVAKIDRSVLTAAVTLDGTALLRGVAALVQNLGMVVLCEGAETREQVELLREIGYDYIQGYYYYRPMPLREAECILDQLEITQ